MLFTPCPCFSCGKQIRFLSQHLINVVGAIDVLIEGSYGSKFDLATMQIWICDQCIEEKMEERIVMIVEDVTHDYTLEEENE